MNYSQDENTKNKKIHKTTTKKVKNKVGVLIFRIFLVTLLICGFALAGAGIGAYMGIIEKAPLLPMLEYYDQNYTSIIYVDSTGEELDRFDGGENRETATYDEIPKHLGNAFIAIEDERFYSHNGVDLRGLVRAVYQTLTSDSTQGASTITQQLIKNKLGLLRNTPESKLQEQYLAIQYEKDLIKKTGSKEKAKEKILTEYMNAISLGSGQVGVRAAAKFYFNLDVSELDLAQCAALAAITQNPTKYSPLRYPEENKKRQTVALDGMLKLGMITQTEHDKAMVEDVYSRISEVSQAAAEAPSYHSYFVDALFEQILEDLQAKGYSKSDANDMIYYGGLKIYATIDKDIQAIVDKEFTDDANFPESEFELDVEYRLSVKDKKTGQEHHYRDTTTVKTKEEADAFIQSKRDEWIGQDGEITAEMPIITSQPQSAFVIMDYYTGEVKAIAGKRGEKVTNREFNRATQAPRQPGSVFKVLASFAPALDMGLITPATVYDDAPYTIPEYHYSPSNWYRNPNYRGLNTVRTAIAQSMNIITVKNMMTTGIENCMNYLYNFGFETIRDSDHVPAASLGGVAGVYQTEVAGAYGTIANGGMYNRPKFYTKVFDHNDNILLENNEPARQVLKRTTAFLLTDMMQDVITAGTGSKARFSDIKMPIAGKTGTTTGTKDLTFVGYTPYYVASIWLGYDNAKEMNDNIGGVHLSLWRKIMEQVHQNLEYKEFDRPEGVVSSQICIDSGKLAVQGLCGHDPRGNRVRTELFAVGTQPAEYCDAHMAYEVCSESSMVPSEYCPADTVLSTVGIRRESNGGADPSQIKDSAYQVPQAVLNGTVCDIHTLDGLGEIDDLITPNDGGNPIYIEPGSVNNNTIEGYPTPAPPPTVDQPNNTPVVFPTPIPTSPPSDTMDTSGDGYEVRP